jgi:hypothetical protein
MSTNTTAPVIVGIALGIVELGTLEGVNDGTVVGAAVTKFTLTSEL